MKKEKFTVDSQLMKELGERLVGKPSIALAELIKNSYDADAEDVWIKFDTESEPGSIIVEDNGIGMTYEEFKDYWMRIGSTHKDEWDGSPEFGRPLTGQKGVGRLSAQFLARKLTLETVSKQDTTTKLKAYINWEKAIEADELVEVTMEYEFEEGDFDRGTKLILEDLVQNWRRSRVKELAKELWELSPPLPGFKSKKGRFDLHVSSENPLLERTFNEQQDAFLKNFDAKITGENDHGHVTASIEFDRNDPAYPTEPINFEYDFEDISELEVLDNIDLKNGEFQIRIYTLQGRQKYGIRVQELREYMEEFSGVHIYDGGFHLPFYGTKKEDWLGILGEHAQRKTKSAVLPDDIQVERAMQNIPQMRRIFGVVTIHTGEEPNLDILITRDRLKETDSFQALKGMVRYAIHYYANEVAKIKQKKKVSSRDIHKKPSEKSKNVKDVLKKYEDEVEDETIEKIEKDISTTIEDTERRDEKRQEQLSLLASYATAGISSIEYHHEIRTQIGTIEDIKEDMVSIAEENPEVAQDLNRLEEELSNWLERTRGLQALFDDFADTDNLQTKKRMNAKRVISDILGSMEFFEKQMEKNLEDLSSDFKLPKGALVEWNSIFQNVFTNAINAMEESDKKELKIWDREFDGGREILIEDTGCGINLEKADEYFQPFKRDMKIPEERKALGYGGTGIGLTIVKFIADKLNCEVSFVEPSEGYATAFSIKWRE